MMEVEMGILDTAPGLLEALKGEMTPKFLATRDAPAWKRRPTRVHLMHRYEAR